VGLARQLRDDLHLALSFLTRLPLPALREMPADRLARSMRLFPLAGLVVGGVSALVYGAAFRFLGPVPAAWLALAASIALTGALHEDGLADIADGFGGGADKPAKLAIMRDSRLGSYGVLALVLGLLLRGGALSALAEPGRVAVGLLVAHCLSRAVIPLVMLGLPPARDNGLGAGAGRPSPGTATIAVLLALVVTALLLPVASSLTVVLAALTAAFLLALLARRQIGGQTGDVLGAVQQVTETAVLLAAVGGP